MPNGVLKIWNGSEWVSIGGGAGLTDDQLAAIAAASSPSASNEFLTSNGVSIDSDSAVSGAGIVIVNKSDDYTFADGDQGKLFIMTVAAKTFTMPAQSAGGSVFSIKDKIYMMNKSGGTCSVAVTTDSLDSDGSKTDIKDDCMAALIKTASAEWTLSGGLE